MSWLLILILFLVFLGLVVTLFLTRSKTPPPKVNPVPKPMPVTASPVKSVAGVDCVIVNECPVMAAPGGDPDLEYPVGTILIEEAPEVVQQELLTGTPVSAFEDIEVPDYFDAREQWPGAISEPYQQGTCGSCWAFASAMAVSDRIRIKDQNNSELRLRFKYRPFGSNGCYEVMNNLSPYELVYCDICDKTKSKFPLADRYTGGQDQACDMGCSGGFLPVVYNYMLNQGVSSLISDSSTPTPKPLPVNPVSPSCPPCPGTPTPAPINCCSCTTGLPISTTNPAQCCSCTSTKGTLVSAANAKVINGCCDPTKQDCPCQKTGGTVYKPKRVYSVVSPNESEEVKRRKIMADIYKNGPVTVGYPVFQSFYDFYNPKQNPGNATKVYSKKAQRPLDQGLGGHAVDIIGWGTEEETGIFYWLIRNSWGISWGDRGYFRMQYNFGGTLNRVQVNVLDNVMAAEV